MADDRTYIRVHDGLDENHKIEGLSDSAFRLLISSWCYCSRNLTDGRITDAAWKKRGTPKSRRDLIAAGLVEQHDGFVQMHDYLRHQRSAAQVAELREQRRAAGKKGGRAKANALANAKQTPSKTVAETEADTEVTTTTSFEGGSHVSRDSRNAAPLYPDHCEAHGFVATPGNCGDCADQRKANAVNGERLPDYRLRVVPDLCGECDERWIETPTGMARCPRCNPAVVNGDIRAEEAS